MSSVQIRPFSQELQGEKAMLNAELMSLKCRPNAASGRRGNSLFGEVEDKRVMMASKLDLMTRKYKELKTHLLKKNTEMKTLEVICYFICNVCDKVNVV